MYEGMDVRYVCVCKGEEVKVYGNIRVTFTVVS